MNILPKTENYNEIENCHSFHTEHIENMKNKRDEEETENFVYTTRMLIYLFCYMQPKISEILDIY